jgi:hypothetical protein
LVACSAAKGCLNRPVHGVGLAHDIVRWDVKHREASAAQVLIPGHVPLPGALAQMGDPVDFNNEASVHAGKVDNVRADL